jgi:hypothetical protein
MIVALKNVGHSAPLSQFATVSFAPVFGARLCDAAQTVSN